MSLEEAEKLSTIVKNIENIDKKIAGTTDQVEIKKLNAQKQLLFIDIAEMHLYNRLKLEGLNDDLIQQFAHLASQRSLLSNVAEIKNNYDLSSDFITSKETNETIGVKYMPLSDKIETIYYHTGEIVSVDDPVIVNNCENASISFIEYLAANYESELQTKFGSNWKEEISKKYKQNYNNSMTAYIGQIVEKVDNEKKQASSIAESSSRAEKPTNNGETTELEQLRQSLADANSTIKSLTLERDELRNEVQSLNSRIIQIQQEHKTELEQLKNGIVIASTQNIIQNTEEQPSIRI